MIRRMRRSEYVLGRKPVRERFYRDGVVTVAVISCLNDTWRMCLETKAKGRARRPVLYRIRVRAKHPRGKGGS